MPPLLAAAKHGQGVSTFIAAVTRCYYEDPVPADTEPRPCSNGTKREEGDNLRRPAFISLSNMTIVLLHIC